MIRWIVAAALVIATLPASAQPFPSRTIHLIVAYSPGGTGGAPMPALLNSTSSRP